MTGAELICTVNEHDELPQVLVAVHVTVVLPAANVLPDAGLQVTVAAGSPVAVGVLKVATGLHCVIFEGQAPIPGAELICTLKRELFNSVSRR